MKIKIPQIAKGCILPYSVLKQIAKEEQKKKNYRKQKHHDYIVSTVGAILGAIATLIITNWPKIANFIIELAP